MTKIADLDSAVTHKYATLNVKIETDIKPYDLHNERNIGFDTVEKHSPTAL